MKKVTLTLVGLMAGVVFLTVYIHRLGQEKVCIKYQEHQLVHAQNVADEIEEFLQEHLRTLQTILNSNRDKGMEPLLREIDRVIESNSGMVKAKYFNGVSLYDQFGKTVYSTGSPAGLQAARFDELLAGIQKNGDQEKFFVSPLAVDRVVIAIPVYQNLHQTKNFPNPKNFVGIFSITFDLKRFFLREPAASRLKLHENWIVRKDGMLLFHSQHPEMVSRNLSQRDETCNRCHISSQYMEKIFKEKEGNFEYQVKNGPKKLAAFSSIQFGNASWVVVVNSEYELITGFMKQVLQAQLALLGLVFFAFLAGSFQLLRKERMKTKAEEEAKSWQEEIIERKKVEEELKKSTDRLHFLSMQLLNAQERERRRIANELHDELGQDLTVLKLSLGHILKKLPEDREELRELTRETLSGADHLMENVRRVFHDLSPHVLEHFGLTVALQRLIKDFSKLHEIGVEEEIINIDQLVPKEAHIIVYRILQEILNNIGKHAQAALISVVLKTDRDHLHITVEDDGKGFDVNRTVLRSGEGKGMGLAILEERVRMLGGVLDIQSKKEVGTRVNITIPIK